MSDTHLGSRQYMRDDRESDFYEAFREAMEIAIERKVDFIVHSGDLFDTWSPSNRALTEFKETALQMKDAGIPMYLIMGDHDRPKRTDYPAAKIFDFLGITLLGHDGVESCTYSKDGEEVLIVGISNLKGSRKGQLIEEYAEADKLAQAAKNSILISHQAVTGYLIEDACEAKYEDLPKHFSYLAFGHVHDGAIKADSYPLFSYAGSTEMKSIREISAFLKQGKAGNLGTLENGEAKADDVSEIMGIKESWTNLRKSVELSVKNMHGRRDIDDFIKAAESLDPPEDYHKIAGRLRLLSKVKSIFGDRTTGLADYIQPGMMSILDLSGMDQFLANYFSYRVVNEIYESKLTSQYKYPVFIFIEEAHNFVPPGSSTQISQIIKKVASEGRKFGIFLVVITQRPGKIDQDVLSQCNSEIILRITNPLDQKAILESGESISQAVIDDLPSLNVGEAILVGQFVKVPVNVKVRSRESKEGGGDIDVVALLRESRMERDEKNSASGDLKRISRILGD